MSLVRGWTCALVLALSLVLQQAGQALVEPEVEAWQELVEDLEQGFGPIPVAEAASEFGNFGSSLAAAPFSDLMEELELRRGLKFKYFTPWHVKDKTGFSVFIKSELAKEYTPEKVDRDEALLKALGLVPIEFKLLDFYGDLLSDAVAGVYVPDTDQFFLIDMTKGQGLSDRLAAKAVEQLTGDASTAIIIHELDHALGGQHFPLRTTFERLQKSTTLDQQIAILALVEGDATFVMVDHQHKRPAVEGGSKTLVAGADMIADMMSYFPGFLPGMGKFSEAPLYFQRSLMFPYFGGAEFVSTLKYNDAQNRKLRNSVGSSSGGQLPNLAPAQGSLAHEELVARNAESWESVNNVYQNLPNSSEQIFHPFRYMYLLREPASIDFKGIPEPFGAWSKVGDDTGGEFLIRVVLEQYGVENFRSAADGWHGDKIRVFRHKKTGALGFYWVIVWDNQREADEFYHSLGSHLPFVVEKDGLRTILSLAFDKKALLALRKGLEVSSTKQSGLPD